MATHTYNFIDLTGQVFGRLTVLGRVENSQYGRSYFSCLCSCGNLKEVRSSHLRSSRVRSCGCYRKGSSTHVTWENMLSRCFNQKNKSYKNYGGRGITVCKEWLDYSQFLKDMGERPGPEYSLERKDTNGNYEPDNCIWADWPTQCRNRRSNHMVIFRGEGKTLIEWSEIIGLPYKSVHARIVKLQWSVERALSEPIRTLKKNGAKSQGQELPYFDRKPTPESPDSTEY